MDTQQHTRPPRVAVVFSSVTGNTRRVAAALAESTGDPLLRVSDMADPAAFDVLALGFWVRRGQPDPASQALWRRLQGRLTFWFGTLGAWPWSEHAAGCRQAAAAPAATAAQPSSAATTAAPSATTRPYAAPAAPSAPAQSSGMSSTLLGAGAGLVGGYMLGSALSGPDAAAAAPAGAEAAQPEAVPAPAAAPSPVTALLGYDTAGYCTQLAQGNAELLQQCTAAEAEAEAAFRSCVAMSSGMNGIGSYEMLLRCLRAPAAR